MANSHERGAENIPGEFFVDTTCIDCAQCRELAPVSFGDGDGQACVRQQPVGKSERLGAVQALLSCPVGAIGGGTREEVAEAAATFPLPIEDNVYYCGYAARTSYGASSYLMVRPEGNVLVDSPRFAGPLVRRLESLGGVRWMFLSHVDDIADHARFRAHFGCERIIHERELQTLDGGRRGRSGAAGKANMEIVIEGERDMHFAPDLTIIPTPGHTAGHQTLLARDKFLFTGDHLWWSPALNRLNASRTYCWYSWPRQIDSLRRLLSYNFEWVLPGHGRRYHASTASMRESLVTCLNAV